MSKGEYWLKVRLKEHEHGQLQSSNADVNGWSMSQAANISASYRKQTQSNANYLLTSNSHNAEREGLEPPVDLHPQLRAQTACPANSDLSRMGWVGFEPTAHRGLRFTDGFLNRTWIPTQFAVLTGIEPALELQYLKSRVRIELTRSVLQTNALPLGDLDTFSEIFKVQMSKQVCGLYYSITYILQNILQSVKGVIQNSDSLRSLSGSICDIITF